MKRRLKIDWSENMLHRLKYEFPYAYNKYLALDLGVSIRTLIRKARELGINKEPGFLEKRRSEISRMAQARKPPNPFKGRKGWSVPGGEKYRFKKGNISPMATSQEVRNKARLTRLKTIEEERARIEVGLPQLTKLKLSV